MHNLCDCPPALKRLSPRHQVMSSDVPHDPWHENTSLRLVSIPIVICIPANCGKSDNGGTFIAQHTLAVISLFCWTAEENHKRHPTGISHTDIKGVEVAYMQ